MIVTAFVSQRQARRTNICRLLIGGVISALLSCSACAQAQNDKGKNTIPTLAQLIRDKRWADARSYVEERQNAVLPEIWAIVKDPRLDGTTADLVYRYLRKIPTLESAMLLAHGLANGAGEQAPLGLTENPRAEVYPILKAKLRPPEEETRKELLLTMAQMPVSVEERIDDLWPYLAAKDFAARHGAMFGLALLDEPAGIEHMVRELGTKNIYVKEWFLRTFYMFPAWRIPRFVPLLIPVLNDPAGLVHIGIRQYNATGGETQLTAEELRYKRTRDFALNIIVAILKLEVPFRIADYTTYTVEQREIVKQKLRELGYTVTDDPYPMTDPR